LFLLEIRKQAAESLKTAIAIGVWWLLRSGFDPDVPDVGDDPSGAALGILMEAILIVAAVLIVAIVYAAWSGRPTLKLTWRINNSDVDSPTLHLQTSPAAPSVWCSLVLHYRVTWGLRWFDTRLLKLTEASAVVAISPNGYVSMTVESDPTRISSHVESGIRFGLTNVARSALLSVVRVEIVPNVPTGGVPLTVTFDVDPAVTGWKKVLLRKICAVNSLSIETTGQ
jgi:hypothetical protein